MNRNAHRWSTKKYVGPKGYEAAKACLSSALKVKLYFDVGANTASAARKAAKSGTSD